MVTKPFTLRYPALVRAVFVSVLLTIVAPAILAQTLDTGILGTVTDEQGTVVPGATVTFTQPATGFTRIVMTGPDGGYEVRYLRPGEYSVEVQLTGFRTERRKGITLQLSQLARIDVRLRVGEIRDTVEVTAAPPLLQTKARSWEKS